MVLKLSNIWEHCSKPTMGTELHVSIPYEFLVMVNGKIASRAYVLMCFFSSVHKETVNSVLFSPGKSD